jgi:hypothetical protein
LATLGVDHDQVRSLSAAVRVGLAEGAHQDVVRDLRALARVLEPHSALEEGGLYLELAAEGVPTAALAAEHEAIDAAVVAATGGPLDPTGVVGARAPRAAPNPTDALGRVTPAPPLLGDDAWDRLDQHLHDHLHAHGIDHPH